MKSFFHKHLLFLTLGIGLALSLLLSPLAALAATPNASLSSDVVVIPLHISGQYTATTAAVAKFKLPFSAYVLGVSAEARASGGTSPTLTVDVQEGGTSILSTPVALTAGTVVEATVSDKALADEATVTVDLAIGGTTPTWNDITVLLTLVRK